MRATPAKLAVFAIAGLGVAGAGVATGCGDGPAGERIAAPGLPSRTVDVELAEWRIDAGPRRVRAGRVTFAETNTGREEHDLLIVRTDLPAERLPAGLEGVAPQLAGEVVLGAADGHTGHGGAEHDHAAGHGHAAGQGHVRSGGSRSRTVTLAPGRYVLICPIPGHYERGQRAVLTAG
jgi:uncharacterized cupredoxin-like copper-binding protein